MRPSSLLLCVLAVSCGKSLDTTVVVDAGDAPDAGGEQGGGADAGTTPDAGASGSRVGDPCRSASDCPAGGSGATTCLISWPQGYCAVSGCAQHGHDCPNDPGLGSTSTVGGKCVNAPTATCLALCADSASCRAGYVCEQRDDAAGHGTSGVCVPTPDAGSQPIPDAGMAGGEDGGMGGGGMDGDGGMMGGTDGGM